jgi:RHH-type proline utilization regulon transcriptional repressor/proline dehydrogenase/delta 1-pyrroline-5-carboxylate dehydrogenase
MQADNLNEAIKLVNGTPYGLTSGLESLSKKEMDHWKNSVIAGNLYFNRSTTGAIVQRQPFGGVKASSFGFGMKAGGPNYIRQFINLKTKKRSLIEIEKEFKSIYKEHFSVETDCLKIRGQHNVFRYIKTNKIVVLTDHKTKKEDLEIVLLSCKITEVPYEIVSIDKNNTLGHQTIKRDKLISLLNTIDLKTRFRSLIQRLPEDFLRECHKKNISIYNRPPCTNGRFELLNYFREQSLSINFHRYGNLMGETNL